MSEKETGKPLTRREFFGKSQTLKYGDLEVGFVVVSPQLGRRLQQANKNNRNKRPMKVAHFGSEMARKNWQLNGSSIVLDTEGWLFDGQHRVDGGVDFNESFETLGVYGVSPVAHSTIDQGTRRSLSDLLVYGGVARHLAADTGAALDIAMQLDLFRLVGQTSSYATPEQKLDWFDANQSLVEHVDYARATKKTRTVTPSIMAGIVYFGENMVGADELWSFFEQFHTLANQPAGSPILVLRDYFDSFRTGSRLQKPHVVASTHKAINAWLAGRSPVTVRAIRWNPGGSRPEPFPLIEKWE